MKVILTEDVANLGLTGQAVEVKRGYARNYLLPKGLAVEATGRSLKRLDHHKRIIDAQLAKRRETAQDLKRAIEALSLSIPVHVGEGDRLYGSVTNRDIEDALRSHNVEVDRRKIVLAEPIKAIGVFEVDVRLHPDVVAKLKVWVVKKDVA